MAEERGVTFFCDEDMRGRPGHRVHFTGELLGVQGLKNHGFVNIMGEEKYQEERKTFNG
jgi:hypothetical protein